MFASIYKDLNLRLNFWREKMGLFCFELPPTFHFYSPLVRESLRSNIGESGKIRISCYRIYTRGSRSLTFTCWSEDTRQGYISPVPAFIILLIISIRPDISDCNLLSFYLMYLYHQRQSHIYQKYVSFSTLFHCTTTSQKDS